MKNIHYKLALKEIANSETWELASPATDRAITQTNVEKLVKKAFVLKNTKRQLVKDVITSVEAII